MKRPPHIGENVAKGSVANSLSNSLSSLTVGKNNAQQALSISNAGYSVIEDSLNILGRQKEA